MTMWMLMWSIIFIAFAGLAIDVANLYRTRAMLSATADAASHAGAVALAEGGSKLAVQVEAERVALMNMPAGTTSGAVVAQAEVIVGVWDADDRRILPDAPDADAVHVIARRTEATDNAVDTFLLRILDFNTWNVAVASVSTAGTATSTPCGDDEEFPNAVVAGGEVNFTSNTTFAGQLCVHGEEGVEGRQNNVTIGEGVIFTMPNAYEESDGGLWDVGSCLVLPDFGEEPIADCYRYSGSQMPWHVEPSKLLATAQAIMDDPDGDEGEFFGFDTQSSDYLYISDFKKYDQALFAADLVAGKYSHYKIVCQKATDKILFPQGIVISGVTIVTNCLIDAPSDFTAKDLTIISTNTTGMVERNMSQTSADYLAVTDTDNNYAISFAGKAVDGGTCGDPEFGLYVYTPGSVFFAGQGEFSTLEMYIGGNFVFAAQGTYTSALDIYVWGDVDFPAQGALMPCKPNLIGSGGGTNPFDPPKKIKIVG